MLKGEFRKYFTSFNIILLMSLFVLNLLITVYQFRDNFSEKGKIIRINEEKLLDTYLSNPETYAELYAEYKNRENEYEARQYEHLMSDDKIIIQFENRHIDYENYDDRELFSKVNSIINYSGKYRSDINSLLKDSAMRIKELTPEDKYLYTYYLDILNIYSRFDEMEFPVYDTAGWERYFTMETPLIFITVASVALFCQVFTIDNCAKMGVILHISKKGTRQMIKAKLLFIGLSSAVITAVFTVSPLIVVKFACGLCDISAPVQMIPSLEYCHYPLTIGGYFLVFILIRMLVFLCLSLGVAAASQYTNSEAGSVILAVLLIVGDFFLNGLSPSSSLYWLQKFSPMSIVAVNPLFQRYRGLHLFDRPLDYTMTVIVVVSVITALLVIISILKNHRYGGEMQAKRERLSHSRHSVSLFGYEIYKQLVCESGIYILIAAVMLKGIISFVYYNPQTTASEEVYINYIHAVQGEITDEKLEYIENEKAYIDGVIAKYPSVVSDYRNGNISSSEYSDFIAKHNYAKYCERACERLCERRDYLLSISDEYSNAEFIYEEGAERFINSPIDIAGLMALLFIMSRIFPLEYDSGFDKLVRCTKFGRKKIFLTKLTVGILISAVVYTVFLLIDIASVNMFYKLDYLNSGLISIPGTVPCNLSIFECMVIQRIVGFAGYILCAIAVMLVSLLAEKQIYAMILSGMLIFVPMAMSYLGVAFADVISISELCLPDNIFSAVPTALVCVSGTVALMCFALRKWIGGAKV